MSLWRLIFRSLAYYRRSNLAVVLGAAVGVAVITGSLLVGDSVRGSLRHLAEERLGRADFALTSPRFVSRRTVAAMAESPGFAETFDRSAAIIALDGTAVDPQSDLAVPEVSVLGVDERFWRLAERWQDVPLEGRTVIVNRAMAEAVGLGVGQSVLLRVPRVTAGQAGSVFGRRSREDTVQELRVTIGRIIDDAGLGRFTLRSDRPGPRNVHVSLSWLAQQLGVADRANVLLVAGKAPLASAAADAETLTGLFGSAAALEDYGLRLVHNAARGYWSLESVDMALPPQVVDAGLGAAMGLNLRATPTSVYLANELSLVATVGGAPVAGKSVPYSTVAAVDLSAPAPFGPMTSATSAPLPAKLAAGEMLLNSWAADDLGAAVGDRVAMTYYRVRSDGTLDPGGRKEFTVRGVVALDGPARDHGLVPALEGVTNVEDMRRWDPPFEIKQGLIRPKDDEYWRTYRATPKAYLSFEDARDIWHLELLPTAGSAGAAPADWSWVTSVRIAGAASAETLAAEAPLKRQLLAAVSPQSLGLAFRPVKAMALAASGGSTDFASLFLGMSFFLVASAALLVALLMRLSVELRARQIGTLLAIGLRPSAAVRLMVLEGVVLSLAATAVGVPLGVAYARGIMAALATLWVGALGPFTLSLHVTALSLVIGGVAGLAVSLVAVWLAARILRRTEPLALLGGWRAVSMDRAATRRTRGVRREGVVLVLVVAGIITARAVIASSEMQFFVIGALVLASGLTAASMVLFRFASRRGSATVSLVRLAARDAARSRLRSLLTVGLMATASFAIVAVAANRVDLAAVPMSDRASGTGGFTFIARSDLPLYLDPGTPEGRAGLGFSAAEEKVLSRATIVACRVRSGDDASCLNLQQPMSPRVVGAPPALVARGGFTFASSLATDGAESPWNLLDAAGQGVEPAAVPAIGDEASVRWILKSGLGRRIGVPGPRGEVPLRIVGLLKGSLWQSDLLISESEFVKGFGADGGYRLLLIESGAAQAEAVRRTLMTQLGDMGLDVRPAAEVLAQYAGVRNAYLSTFQTLGGLGLVLGTFAVVTVLLRNVVERRSELGMMMALGFRRGRIVGLVTMENMLLVVGGLAIGVVSALVAVAPHMRQAGADVPWLKLGLTMLVIILVGLAACRVAAGRAVGRELLEAIRSE